MKGSMLKREQGSLWLTRVPGPCTASCRAGSRSLYHVLPNTGCLTAFPTQYMDKAAGELTKGENIGTVVGSSFLLVPQHCTDFSIYS